MSAVLTILGFLLFGMIVVQINNGYAVKIKKKEWNQLKVYKEKQHLYNMNHRDFEYYVAAFLQITRDFKTHVTKAGRDGGKDIVAYDEDNEPIYVEVKHWKGNVGRPDVQKLEGAMSADRVRRGYFITSSGFTKDALEYATKTNITLIDGNELIRQMHT
ncbi:restriction endonuclease [Bacillus sp. AFS041924]|uniref:restriction endonuclease n=1 Tax=Bacillus sp. AFS041924 TaxID=2033503 RepID=UPI00159BCBA3|nr:restriction endonuclease [Bacillus sp. AFS041924]